MADDNTQVLLDYLREFKAEMRAFKTEIKADVAELTSLHWLTI